VYWALAYFMLWLSRISAENGSLSDTLRYLVKAAYYDPKLMQNPDYIRMLPGHIRRCTAKMPGLRAGSIKPINPIASAEPIGPPRNFSIRDLEYAHERLTTKTALGKLKEERRAAAARILSQARMAHGRFHPNAPSIGFNDQPSGGREEQGAGARPAIALRSGEGWE
jgi:hypothetical protein